MRKISLVYFSILALALSAACSTPQVSQTKNPLPADNGSPSTPVSSQPAPQAAPDNAGYPVTVTDDLGRNVTLAGPPQRIVSLAPSNTEILFALGLDDRIVGVTDYCDYPEAAKTKAKVAGYSTPNLEKLVSLQPDLVVGEAIHEKTVLPALEKLGLTVYIASGKTIDTILNDITVLGTLTGSQTQAVAVVNDMNNKIKGVTGKTQNLSAAQKPRILYVNWHDPIWTTGANTFIDDVINKAGGTNVYENDFEKAKAVSLESVIIKNPQVIIVSGMGTSGDTIYAALKGERRLVSTDAMSKNRIYKVSDANLVERPGPRIADGLIEVASMIHPEIFGPK